jgi:hypothetical protein
MPDANIIKTFLDYGVLGAAMFLFALNLTLVWWMLNRQFTWANNAVRTIEKAGEAVEQIRDALK